MAKEYYGTTIIGLDLRNKMREIKLSHPEFLDMTKAQIVSYAFEMLYLEATNKGKLNKPKVTISSVSGQKTPLKKPLGDALVA